jgi:hypothetical protein
MAVVRAVLTINDAIEVLPDRRFAALPPPIRFGRRKLTKYIDFGRGDAD